MVSVCLPDHCFECQFVVYPSPLASQEQIRSLWAKTEQMSVAVHWSSGSTETADRTKVTWSVSDTTIGSIDSSGIFTGNKAGRVTLTASYNGLTVTKTVTVADDTKLFQTPAGAGTIYKKNDTDSSGAQAVRYWIYPDPYNPNYVVMPENDGSKWAEITELLNGQ